MSGRTQAIAEFQGGWLSRVPPDALQSGPSVAKMWSHAARLIASLPGWRLDGRDETSRDTTIIRLGVLWGLAWTENHCLSVMLLPFGAPESREIAFNLRGKCGTRWCRTISYSLNAHSPAGRLHELSERIRGAPSVALSSAAPYCLMNVRAIRSESTIRVGGRTGTASPALGRGETRVR